MSTVVEDSSAAYVTPTEAPAWARGMRAFTERFVMELGGGPKVLKAAWVINFQKAGTFIVYAVMMWYYADKTPAATSTAA